MRLRYRSSGREQRHTPSGAADNKVRARYGKPVAECGNGGKP